MGKEKEEEGVWNSRIVKGWKTKQEYGYEECGKGDSRKVREGGGGIKNGETDNGQLRLSYFRLSTTDRYR